MAASKVLVTSRKQWKQWWRKSPNSCCSKKILLLLVWQALFSFSNSLILSCAAYLNFTSPFFVTVSQFVSGIFAPLIGWLADVKFGRYEIIKFGSLLSLPASAFSILHYSLEVFRL